MCASEPIYMSCNVVYITKYDAGSNEAEVPEFGPA